MINKLSILGHHMQPCDPLCVPLTLEDLARLEERHLNGGGCVHALNNHLMSMLWKVGGEGNPISGSQAPLLCDVTLEMHCLQVMHHTLHKANTYQTDDRQEKVKFVYPDWEVVTGNLVHDMAEQYMLCGIRIPENIIAKLSSYEMSLGNAAHKNYAIIDDWVSEALH